MTDHERQATEQVNALRRQIGGLLWLRAAVVGAAVFCFAWGTAVLVARAGWRVERELLALGAIGLLPVAGVAWYLASRRMPATAVLRALVDRRNDAGGLIMAAEETSIGDWNELLAEPFTPRVRWRGGRGVVALLVGAGFVVTAFALPDSVASLTDRRALNVDQPVAELQQQIETLEEEDLISSEEAAELEEKLEQIKKDASGTDPNKTWAQLDAIQTMIDKSVDEAAEDAISEAGRMAELEALAGAIDKALEGLKPGEMDPGEAGSEMGEDFTPVDPEDLADAMAELSEMVEAARMDSKDFEKLLDPETAKMLEKMAGLTPEELKELAELDDETIEKLKEIAEKLKQAEEIEADTMVRIDAAGDVTVFDPEDKLKLADLKKGTKPKRDVAVRWTTEAVFREDPAVWMSIDMSQFGEGERIVAMKEDQELAVYKLDAGAKVDLAKLDKPDKEVVLVVDAAGAVQRYVYDPSESAQCQACEGGGDPKVFRMTAQAAKLSKEQMKQAMERLAQAGMLTPAQAQAMAGACQGNQPGQGGISRGRGDAPMTWKDPSSEADTAFKEQTLPPAQLEAIRNSQLIGVSTGAPQLTDGDGSSAHGALSGAATGGGSAERQAILPVHRPSVERYFERE